jgi:hypothetical protein
LWCHTKYHAKHRLPVVPSPAPHLRCILRVYLRAAALEMAKPRLTV